MIFEGRMTDEREETYRRELSELSPKGFKLARLFQRAALEDYHDGRGEQNPPAPVYVSLASRLTRTSEIDVLIDLLREVVEEDIMPRRSK